jgi:hypothetical protein
MPARKRPQPSPEQPVSCPVCGSEAVVEIEGEGPTGVVAPDGGRESRMERAWKCLKCGAVEEI